MAAWRRNGRVSRAVTTLAVLLVSSASAGAATWSVSPVDTGGSVGQYSSLVLDADGNPVIAYYDASSDDLLLAHCNDPRCEGGDEVVSAVDTSGNVGLFTSLELDAAGNPVISYYDATRDDLKLAHCDDPNCAGGGESIQTVDSSGNTGRETSLALDSAGNPVISYRRATGGDLKLAHCDDPNCAGGGESIQTVDSSGNTGRHSSLRLDDAGNPVIAYYNATSDDLKLARCDDSDCAGAGERTETLDRDGNVGEWPSLALRADGVPVVSYYRRSSGDLKIAVCDDPGCAGGRADVETVASSGNVGRYSSLELDPGGNPVIAYLDQTGRDLKLARVFPAGRVTPGSLEFGDVQIGASSVLDATIESIGDADLDFSSALIDGRDSEAFRLPPGTDTCSETSLQAGATCTIRIAFEPGSTGPATAVVRLRSNAADGPIEISLAGTGTQPPPPPRPPGATDPEPVEHVPGEGPGQRPAPSLDAAADHPASDETHGAWSNMSLADGGLFSLTAHAGDPGMSRRLRLGLTQGPTSNAIFATYGSRLTIAGTHTATPGTSIHVYGPRLRRRKSTRLSNARPGLARLATARVDEDSTFSVSFRVRPAGQYLLVIGDGRAQDREPFWITLRPHLRGRVEGRTARLWARPPQALAGARAVLQARTRRGWRRIAVTRFDPRGRARVRLATARRRAIRMVVPADRGGRFSTGTQILRR